MENYGLKTCWTKCWEGLSGNNEGYSIKKMIAALFSTTVVILLFIYTNKENFLTVLPILLGFISTMIVVRTIEKNNILKNTTPDEKSPA